IATVPPPAWPEALIAALGASATAPVVFTATEPPDWPGALPAADTVPAMITSPPRPDISTWPAWPPVRVFTVSATIRPPALTRVCTTPSTASAVMTTLPPLATTRPSLVTSALVPSGAVATCFVTLMLTSPSPYRSSVWVSAPARMTVPMLARMTPELTTRGATSAARPCSFIVMVPWLTIWAPGFGAWSNTILPAMKLLLLIPAADTTSPAVFTTAPSLKNTPAWLTSTTRPFASICPAMVDGSGPITRLSVVAVLLGCWYWTVYCAPTL